MQKILGISGSPRKPGNCEIMLKAVCRHVPEEHELRLLRLADFNLKPCKGCYRCLFREKQCILKDISKEYRKDGTWLKPEPRKQ